MGTHGPLVIYQRANQLYCQNTDADNLITALKHSADNSFVLDDNAHVTFAQAANGTYAKVSLLVSDGNAFKERRKKPSASQ